MNPAFSDDSMGLFISSLFAATTVALVLGAQTAGLAAIKFCLGKTQLDKKSLGLNSDRSSPADSRFGLVSWLSLERRLGSPPAKLQAGLRVR